MRYNNLIRNWSYDLPTEPGLYLMCYGDVVTHDNTKLVRFTVCTLSGALTTDDGLHPDDYSASCKWTRLLVSETEVRDENI